VTLAVEFTEVGKSFGMELDSGMLEMASSCFKFSFFLATSFCLVSVVICCRSFLFTAFTICIIFSKFFVILLEEVALSEFFSMQVVSGDGSELAKFSLT